MVVGGTGAGVFVFGGVAVVGGLVVGGLLVGGAVVGGLVVGGAVVGGAVVGGAVVGGAVVGVGFGLGQQPGQSSSQGGILSVASPTLSLAWLTPAAAAAGGVGIAACALATPRAPTAIKATAPAASRLFRLPGSRLVDCMMLLAKCSSWPGRDFTLPSVCNSNPTLFAWSELSSFRNHIETVGRVRIGRAGCPANFETTARVAQSARSSDRVHGAACGARQAVSFGGGRRRVSLHDRSLRCLLSGPQTLFSDF